MYEGDIEMWEDELAEKRLMEEAAMHTVKKDGGGFYIPRIPAWDAEHPPKEIEIKIGKIKGFEMKIVTLVDKNNDGSF